MDTFGEILVKIRKSCGLTQSELAKKMTELGFSTVPNVLQFFGLCKIMNIYDINSAFHVTETKDPSFILNETGRARVQEYIQLLSKDERFSS